MPRIKINDKNYATDTFSDADKSLQSVLPAMPAGDRLKFN